MSNKQTSDTSYYLYNIIIFIMLCVTPSHVFTDVKKIKALIHREKAFLTVTAYSEKYIKILVVRIFISVCCLSCHGANSC